MKNKCITNKRNARVLSLVKYRDKIRGVGRYQGRAPLSSGHVLVVVASQLRRVIVYAHSGQEILQADYVTEVEDARWFARRLVVSYIPNGKRHIPLNSSIFLLLDYRI